MAGLAITDDSDEDLDETFEKTLQKMQQKHFLSQSGKSKRLS
jgi:hypothetical protein